MKIVNVFQEGGVPKRVSYRSLPKLNRDYGTGDPERVSSVKQSIQSARDWQTNWYAKRKGTGKFEDQLDPETMSFINDKTANSAVIVSDGANYRNNNANGTTRVTEGGTVITANADPTYERIAPSFGRDFDTVLTHELAHAATLKSTSVSGQTQQEFDENSKKVVTPSLMKINDIVGGGVVAGGDNDYINNAAEVQARLNSMRREAKMNPEKTDYTYKDMKYWLKKYNLDYGKDKSELLMNTVAQVTPTDSRTLFAQEGTVLKQDNTRVSKPVIPEIIKAKPRQDQLIDLGGEPSTDTRTAAERNRDYWHPIKGAKERFKSSMRNGTNPLVGLERTVMPAMAGAALVTTPATVVGGLLGSEAVNNATGGFGQWLEGKVGIPAEVGEYLNPGALLTMKKGGSLVSDGRRFKFKDSTLVKNSKTLNNKRDMRKKFMKSDRPTYSNNRVRKGQEGLQFTRYDAIERPTLNMDNTFEEYRFPVDTTPTYTIKREEAPADVQQPIIKEEETPIMKRELFNIKPSKGLDEFNKWYDEVEQEDPEAKNYRQFLTKMAEQESGFNSAIQNRAGAPAYGYFQFMQDGKKYNNISAYAGTDVDTFRNNPKLQIKAAIKLAKQFERGFNKQDLELAAQKGYTKFGLLGGAWLAGNGGVRKYLQGLANPSDRHWSKSGSGTDVASRIQMFNF